MLSVRWGWPGLSEPYIFMCFRAVCRFKGLIPIWEAASALLWAGASVISEQLHL